MDIRQYLNDDARLTLRARVIWRVALPIASAWSLCGALRDPDERGIALAVALALAVASLVAWLWKVEVEGHFVRTDRPPRETAEIDLSRLTSERVEWVWYVRYVARYLILEDVTGEQLTLTWIWWSNWSLLQLVAHEWHMRAGKPYNQ